MNRRAFLKLFAAAGPVAAVAPTYFFAPVGGWPRRFMGCDWGFNDSASAVLTAQDRSGIIRIVAEHRAEWMLQRTLAEFQKRIANAQRAGGDFAYLYKPSRIGFNQAKQEIEVERIELQRIPWMSPVFPSPIFNKTNKRGQSKGRIGS